MNCDKWSTEKAMLWAELHALALPHLTSYSSDLYHDALWIDKHYAIGLTFYFGVSSMGCGTHIGSIKELVLEYSMIAWEIVIDNNGFSRILSVMHK